MSLHCENIVKAYGGKEVLQDVTLDLQPGKIYGLIGRNGAGKTTLLSILSAQNPATRGTVTLDGEPVWENRKSLAKICFSRELNANGESGIAAMKAKEYLRIASTYYEDWNKALEERLDTAEQDREALQTRLQSAGLTVQAMDWFWQIDEAYVRGRYAQCRELIQDLEDAQLADWLPTESITDNGRFSPADRYLEIREKVMR